jgi:hypothetical protein
MRGPFANSRVAVNLRRLRGRFGISARRVIVRTHIPWYWRFAATVVLVALALALAGWIYDAGRSFAGFDRHQSDQELSDLRTRASQLDDELKRMREAASASESKLQIERTARQALGNQFKLLEIDNSKLKEDLAVFENFAGGDPKTLGFGIHRLQVERDLTTNSYHYQMLLAALGSRSDKEFQGQLQLVANVLRDGKAAMLVFPAPGDADARKYLVTFKRFQRVDGVFQVPPDTVVKRVEARLLLNGGVVATQQISL